MKSEIMSTAHGMMYSTWVGGGMGRGCNWLVCDDIHGPEDIFSDVSRESTIAFVRGTLFSRLDHPGHDAIVITGSRVHEDDLTGQLRNPPREETRSEQQSMEAIESATEPVLAPMQPYYIAGAPLQLPCFRPWWMP